MRIVCYVIEPAGVYLAALLKRANPARRVTVVDTAPAPTPDALVLSNLVRPPRPYVDSEFGTAIDRLTFKTALMRLCLDGSSMCVNGLTSTIVSRAGLVVVVVVRDG